MWTPWRKKKPVEMNEAEKAITLRFAKGESNGQAAISVHRYYIPTLGVRGTIEQNFMAEVDNPVPDLRLRQAYSEALISYYEAREEIG